MNFRQFQEQEELTRLSARAAKALYTRGRNVFEEEREDRTCYQRDTDRILHSRAFRRLMHKTQVFLQPEGDHYRTRMTHTLEVTRIARTAARALRLNEDLTEAAAMGHDLGHTPFGHAGEAALTEVLGYPFRHNEQSLRVVDQLEKDGQGLNLTYEVRRGILCHSGPELPETLEGQIVRYADRIAYINHDIDDAMRAGILKNEDIPGAIAEVLGHTHSERINTLVEDLGTCFGMILGINGKGIPGVQKLISMLDEAIYETGYSLESALKGVMKGIRSSVKSILYVPSCLLTLCRTIRTEEGISYRVLPHVRFEGVPLPAGAGRAGLLAMLDLDEGSMQELGRLSDRLGSDPEDMVFLLLSEEISKFKKKLVKKLNKTC